MIIVEIIGCSTIAAAALGAYLRWAITPVLIG